MIIIHVGIQQLLTKRTSRRFIAGRIVTDAEIKLNFLLSKVRECSLLADTLVGVAYTLVGVAYTLVGVAYTLVGVADTLVGVACH